MIRLNELKPAYGSHKKGKRLGRGIGSGLGKTCGKGHKGQKARAGFSKRFGFEGGQIPYQRRVPKFGFTPIVEDKIAEIRLSDLNRIDAEVINLEALSDYGLINAKHKGAKIILSGTINKKVVIEGIKVSKGAREAILQASGEIKE